MRYDPYVNFTAGEISPLLKGRIDIDAYRSACSTLTNFQPLEYGGARRRFGTEIAPGFSMRTARVRLLPFVIGVGQAHILCFENLALTTYSPSSGAATGVASPYTLAQLRDVRWAQSGNFMVLVHPDHPPYALSRLSDTNWWLRQLTMLEPPMISGPVLLTASANLTIEAGLGTRAALGSVFDLFFVQADIGRLISRGTGLGRITAITPDLPADEFAYNATVEVLLDFAGTTGNWFLQGQPNVRLTEFLPTEVGSIAVIEATSPAFRTSEIGSYIFLDGGVFKIEYLLDGGKIAASRVIRKSDKVYTADPPPDPLPPPDPPAPFTMLQPLFGWPAGQSTEHLRMFPRAVAFHDQRLVFGGLRGMPQTFVGSVVGDVIDFTATAHVSDAYLWNIDGATGIQHMAVDNDLLLLTEDAEYAASGSDYATISNADVKIRKQSTDGTSAVAPVKVGREHVFIQRSGKAVMALGFDISINGYDSHNLTLLAEHITGPGIVEVAYARRPVPTLYCVRADGKMACLTLDAKQKVTAWWLWETQGTIESATSIPFATYDDVWMVVRRPFSGSAEARFVERIQQTYQVNGQPLVVGYLLDCASFYSRTPTGAASVVVALGANYAGRTVQVVADGIYGGQYVASGAGSITVPFDYYQLIAGLGYTSTLVPMPPEVQTNAGSGMGRSAHATECTVKLHQSMGGKINGVPITRLDANAIPQSRPLAAAGVVPNYENYLVTGDAPATGLQGWQQGEALVTIVQDEPLPFHVIAVVQLVEANP